jgi:PAS domain S-box-containing protein
MNPQQQASILIVDDLPDNLRTLAAILRIEGYKVRKATSGEMALETIRSQPPDLILLDIKMPQMDGYQVCSTLKAAAETRSIPVIFLSALDEVDDKVKAFRVGGVDYIAKPFQAEEVIARIENQLCLTRLSGQLIEQNALLQHEIRTRKQTEVILQQEIGDRKQAEVALRESAIRLRRQNSVLMELARNPALHQGDLPIALKAIACAIAKNIAVERASVWLFDSTGKYLQCLELFEKRLNRHSQGAELTVADYPTYFQALIHEQFIVADNAYTAPETKEFSESYLTPLGIASMLDAPIRLGGQTVGVLCSEHVGAVRHWTPEDQNFIRSAADLVSLALAAQERKQQEEALRLIVEGTASATGDNFMQACVRSLVEVLQVRYAFISQAVDESLTKFRTLAFWLGETYSPSIEYDIAGTPCEKISNERMYHCPQDLQVLFPNASGLVELNAQCYLGMPLIDSNGNLLGHLSVLDTKPMKYTPALEMILKIFAARTAAELERKQAEEALREREILYRQMFEANTAVKLVINPESGAIVDANPAASRFYGYKLEELKQMKITDLNVLPCDREALLLTPLEKPKASADRVLGKIAQTVSEQHAEFQFGHRLASGEIREVAVYSSLITQQGQQLLYSIIHDITERIQAEIALLQSEARERKKAQELKEALEQLKRTQVQLIQTEKMSSLGRMVAGVAHELNNPVNFIYGNLFHIKNDFQDLLELLELYQQTYPNPTPKIQQLASEIDLEFLVKDWSQLMHSMQVGAERIQEIVQSLKSFSRLDEAKLKPVDIHEGIDNTLLILQPRLKAVGHRSEIRVIKDYGQLPLVTCYASQLNQVFMNLLNNAIDAVDTQAEPRRITIHTSFIKSKTREIVENLGSPDRAFPQLMGDSNLVNGEQQPLVTSQIRNQQSVVILITDNGPGMSEDILHQIFDPFFTTKTVGSGTGLGLSISHQIVVEKHGGQLSCISAPGYGTAFIVEIPILAELGK